jgi:predicted TIM-barrel fold metal-dependent hydrolase
MTDAQPTIVESEVPWIISLDDHVVEPPDVWTSRLSSKFVDRAPHYERRNMAMTRWTRAGWESVPDDESPETDVWVFGDVVRPFRRNVIAVGSDPEELTTDCIGFDEMRKGCYDATARLQDMDLVHVEATMCFPQQIRFCGQEFSETSDKELGLECIKAYNDWMVEEWCATNPKRLIPLIIVPLWDSELAAREIYRNAARGVHAVTFSENPWVLGFESIHTGRWEPFFRACAETETVISLHIGSSSNMGTQNISPDAPLAVMSTLPHHNAASSMLEYIFSGVLESYPALKLLYSESQCGWIPYLLERADNVWSEHGPWTDARRLPHPPSFYFRRQVLATFFRDFVGMKIIDEIGEDNVAIETDYPHNDSTWPHTHELAKSMLAPLTQQQKYKVCRGNAIKLLHLDLDKDRH